MEKVSEIHNKKFCRKIWYESSKVDDGPCPIPSQNPTDSTYNTQRNHSRKKSINKKQEGQRNIKRIFPH